MDRHNHDAGHKGSSSVAMVLMATVLTVLAILATAFRYRLSGAARQLDWIEPCAEGSA